MRQFQTLLILASVCFLINSCVQSHAKPEAAACPAGKKGASCCTVSSRTKSLTQ